MSRPGTRTFATQEQAAAHFKVHPRTIRNWISKGLVTGYRLPGPGSRAIRVDVNEIERLLEVVPTTIVRSRATVFGPEARIVTVDAAENDVPAEPAVITASGASALTAGIKDLSVTTRGDLKPPKPPFVVRGR
jgi:hypothetical protein